jgi:hypothetical protein
MLKIQGAVGIVHIESLYGSGDDMSEGIQIIAPDAVVQIQNVRIEQIRARDQAGFSDNHPDLIQLIKGPRELHIDGLTGTTDYQGLFFAPDTPVETITLRRVNIHGEPTARYLLWISKDGSIGDVTLEDVWLDVPAQRSGGLGSAVWPQSNDTYPNQAQIDTDEEGRPYVTWPADCACNISGRATHGTPSGGDFVSSDAAQQNDVPNNPAFSLFLPLVVSSD